MFINVNGMYCVLAINVIFAMLVIIGYINVKQQQQSPWTFLCYPWLFNNGNYKKRGLNACYCL